MYIDARELSMMIGKRLSVILLTVAVSLVVGAGVCLFAPNWYTGIATVLVKPAKYIDANATAASASLERQEENINSLVELAQSTEVIKRTIASFGIARLYPEKSSSLDYFQRIESDLRALVAISEPLVSTASEDRRLDDALVRARKALSVKATPKTDLIAVSFSHQNSAVASDFVNELLLNFRGRANELYGRSKAADLLAVGRRRSQESYEESVGRLAAFAAANHAYSIEDQRKLALQRRNELVALQIKTRSDILSKQGEAAATAAQISNLKPISDIPQIREAARSAPKPPGDSNAANPVSASAEIPASVVAAPLLMVRVYQDTLQTFVRLKSDLAGLSALDSYQQSELAKVDDELRRLSESEVKVNRLKLEADQARSASEQYASLATKEQLDDEMSKTVFAPIEIAQPAVRALRPTFPNPIVIMPFAALFGLFSGIALSLLLSRQSTMHRGQIVQASFSTAAEQQIIYRETQLALSKVA